jgi:sugar lactone lactonase YvrE
MRLLATSLVIFVGLLIVPPGAIAAKLYFTQNGAGQPLSNIHRMDDDGSSQEIIHTGLVAPFGIDVDPLGGKVYWTDMGSDYVQRKRADGIGETENLVTIGLNDPHDIALDIANGKAYFADRTNGEIKRANLDGSGLESLITLPGTTPQSVELDLVNRRLYWSDTAQSTVYRANLDGSGTETLISGISVSGLAIDPVEEKLYFANRAGRKIQRAELDGTNIEAFLTDRTNPPLDIALDWDTRLIFWSFFDSVQRINLDLTGGIQTLISGLAGSELLNGVNGLSLAACGKTPCTARNGMVQG